MPACLQEQALLRIYALGFSRRYIEKQRVKPVIFFQGPDPLAAGLTGHSRTRLIVGIHIPAVGWHLGDAVSAFRDVLPKLLQVISLRELASHANHCYGMWP